MIRISDIIYKFDLNYAIQRKLYSFFLKSDFESITYQKRKKARKSVQTISIPQENFLADRLNLSSYQRFCMVNTLSYSQEKRLGDLVYYLALEPE